jgi:hypothetical protein
MPNIDDHYQTEKKKKKGNNSSNGKGILREKTSTINMLNRNTNNSSKKL